METNNTLAQFRPRTGKTANAPLLLEIEVYLHLLVVIHLIDVKKYDEVRFVYVCVRDPFFAKTNKQELVFELKYFS